MTWIAGSKIHSWSPTQANVTKIDVEEPFEGEIQGWQTTIEYTIDGKPYEADIDEYLIGNDVTVYVYPKDPTDVVGKPGFRIQDGFIPIVATVFSGLFVVALLLIKFSPKDSESG